MTTPDATEALRDRVVASAQSAARAGLPVTVCPWADQRTPARRALARMWVAAYLAVSPPPPGAVKFTDVVARSFDPSQPRDRKGRWTDGAPWDEVIKPYGEVYDEGAIGNLGSVVVFTNGDAAVILGGEGEGYSVFADGLDADDLHALADALEWAGTENIDDLEPSENGLLDWQFVEDPDGAARLRIGIDPAGDVAVSILGEDGSVDDHADLDAQEAVQFADASRRMADRLEELADGAETVRGHRRRRGRRPEIERRHRAYDPAQPRDGDGRWTDRPGGGLVDKLRLAEKVSLGPGERLVASRRSRGGRTGRDAVMALLDTSAGPELRFGVVEHHGPSWRASEDGHTARITGPAAQRFGDDLRDLQGRSAELQAQYRGQAREAYQRWVDGGGPQRRAEWEARRQEQIRAIHERIDALKEAYARPGPDGKPAGFTADQQQSYRDTFTELETLEAATLDDWPDAPDWEAMTIEGTIPGSSWGDIVYDVSLSDTGEQVPGTDIVDVDVRLDLAVRPKDAGPDWERDTFGNEEYLDLAPADLRRLIRDVDALFGQTTRSRTRTAFRSRVGARGFNPGLHPRAPGGTPIGGRFVPRSRGASAGHSAATATPVERLAAGVPAGALSGAAALDAPPVKLADLTASGDPRAEALWYRTGDNSVELDGQLGFVEMGNYLRYGGDDAYDPAMEGRIAAIDSLMDRSRLDQPITVYRGLDETLFIGRDNEDFTGRTFTDASHVSTTTNPNHAAGGFGRTHMRILAPPGTPAIRMADRDPTQLVEDEILLDRDLTYRVVRDEKIPSPDGFGWAQRILDVEVVPPGAARSRTAAAEGAMPERVAAKYIWHPGEIRWTNGDARRSIARAGNRVHTGAMIALVPSAEDAARLAVDGGEPVDELHLTLVFLGVAADIPAETRTAILDNVAAVAATRRAAVGDAFAVSIFNPDGEDPCLVLGIGGAALERAQRAIAEALYDVEFGPHAFTLPEQHAPWIPHVTLAYSADAGRIASLTGRTGPVVFDRLRVAFAGQHTDFPLQPAAEEAQ